MPKGIKGFQPGNKIGIGNKHNIGRIAWNRGIKRTADEIAKMKETKRIKHSLGRVSIKMLISRILKGIRMSGKTPPLWLIEKRAKAIPRGKEHPFWAGGISKQSYTKNFSQKLKDSIRKRDGYRCQLCGKSEWQ